MHLVSGQLRKLCPALVFQHLVHSTSLRGLLLSGVEVLYNVDEVDVRLLWLKVSVLEVFWDLLNRPLPSRDGVIDLLAVDPLNSPTN